MTAVSDSLAAEELEVARRFAASLGVRHLLPATAEAANPGYRANGRDRCYFCKSELFDGLGPACRRAGRRRVATGTNADDARTGFRPGITGRRRSGRAVTPLLDARSDQGRGPAASRAWGLPTWDKPAAPCLSSRIAYGLEITPARLARVERAEAAVRAPAGRAGLPVTDLRVRDLGDRVRVELDAADAPGRRPAGPGSAVREAGFPGARVRRRPSAPEP